VDITGKAAGAQSWPLTSF